MVVAALIGILVVLGPAIVNSLTARDPDPPPAAQTAPASMQPPADLPANTVTQPPSASD